MKIYYYTSALLSAHSSQSIRYSISRKKAGILSAIVLLGYSLPLYYLFFFRSEYGAGLTYWFYLLVLNLIYILSTAIHLIFKYIKGR